MSSRPFNNQLISPLCKFRDKNLEQQYRNERLPIIQRYFLKIALAFSVAYFAFTISDYFLTSGVNFFYTILARIVTILLPIVLYFATGKLKTQRFYDLTLFTAESFYAFSYIFILSLEQNPDFYLKVFDITMVLLAIFLLPSNWLISACTALINLSVFLIYASIRFPQVPRHVFTSISIYIVLVFALSAISAYRAAATRRIEFYGNLQLHILLNTDTLTGLNNRKKFDEELHRFMRESSGRVLCFCIFDIDDFKLVNDNFGHLAGDQVLIGIADAVQQHKRAQDVVARWGGEEFVIIMPDCPLLEARDYIEGLRIRINSLRFEKKISVTCSFGLTLLRPNDTHDSLLKRADHLLYKAKQMGKDLIMADDWSTSDDQMGLW